MCVLCPWKGKLRVVPPWWRRRVPPNFWCKVCAVKIADAWRFILSRHCLSLHYILFFFFLIRFWVVGSSLSPFPICASYTGEGVECNLKKQIAFSIPDPVLFSIPVSQQEVLGPCWWRWLNVGNRSPIHFLQSWLCLPVLAGEAVPILRTYLKLQGVMRKNND